MLTFLFPSEPDPLTVIGPVNETYWLMLVVRSEAIHSFKTVYYLALVIEVWCVIRWESMLYDSGFGSPIGIHPAHTWISTILEIKSIEWFAYQQFFDQYVGNPQQFNNYCCRSILYHDSFHTRWELCNFQVCNLLYQNCLTGKFQGFTKLQFYYCRFFGRRATQALSVLWTWTIERCDHSSLGNIVFVAHLRPFMLLIMRRTNGWKSQIFSSL